MRAFLHRLSAPTLRARYLGSPGGQPDAWQEGELDRLLDAGSGGHTVLLALDGADVRAVGEFFERPRHAAEVALVVEDAYQGRCMGQSVLRRLELLARARGIRTFTGDVAYGNLAALAVLRGSGRTLHTQIGYGSLRFELLLEGRQ